LPRLLTVVTASVTMNEADRSRDTNFGQMHGADRIHVGAVQRLDDQLDPNEREDHGQADVQVDDALEESADEEVELAKAHQGEGICGKDDVRVLG
jgi:hypothetical protein